MAQVKSPSVKQALASLRGANAVSEASYREALTKHRPALQETYRHYFRERGVAAMVFPTTPLPAAKIGEDDTVMLNGVPVSTTSFWRSGSRSKPCCPGCRRRPLERSLATPAARRRSVLRMELVPLREFYGHPFRAVDEHQLS